MEQHIQKLKKHNIVSIVFFIGIISLMYGGVATLFTPMSYGEIPANNDAEAVASTTEQEVSLPPIVVHLEAPDSVKAAYMSSCVAGTPSFREHVIGIANKTEINSLVVDIKDSSGMLSYESLDPTLQQEKSDDPRFCRIRDIDGLIKELHADNIYVIGRIAVFQDPYFVKKYPNLAVKSQTTGNAWKDRKGITWIDAGSTEMWDYVIAIAKDAYSRGFDEINFDYIRFPSDGNIQDMVFPVSGTTTKSEIVKNFYEYLSGEMKTAGIPTSGDIFGMTTTSRDDLNIGQVLETALQYFDYVSPMVYPSHYPNGFNGWSNPNAHPYELIKFVMDAAVTRAHEASTTPLKIRPWLQDFSMGAPKYGKTEVEAQIQGTYDAGLTSWLLWDPSNKYAGGALLRE